uniref:Fatty acid desaturase domain-containing protein n=1 Tax=Strombidinopsis acuminata TaxID=141414 RepID=A0A7S3X0U9_9SPIT
MLKDQRDVPMLCLMLNIVEALAIGVPLIYGLNLWQPPLPLLTRNLAGLAYVVTNVVLFQERFTLCLHFASHRAIFHNEMLNGILNWAFAPFFGVPCGVYKLHHVIMHHVENNHDLDISSTEHYQRDSWADFGRYWLHFAVLIWFELPRYCARTSRWTWMAKIIGGMLAWVAAMLFLATYVNTLATVWCFVVPHIVAMTAMAFGNWSQHIFVNPKDAQSNYALTYNCIDTKVNQTTFNDGYHIVHHANARLHWTEMPQYFYDNKEKHIAGGALTFRGVHFFDVGILVMTKRLDKLAKHYVHLGPKDQAPSLEAIEEKLRAWLRPVPPAQEKKSK